MGNHLSTVPLLESSGSSHNSSSNESSEWSLGDVEETAVVVKGSSSSTNSRPRTSATTGCLLSFCWTPPTPSPPLLLVNTHELQDDDEEDDSGHSWSSSSCSPRDTSQTTGSSSNNSDNQQQRPSFFRRRSSSISLFSADDPLAYTDEELAVRDDIYTEASDCRDKDLWIVTTAALPWLTGTAVNPLLRAAYLATYNAKHYPHRSITLVVPWLEDSQDRVALYGMDWEEATPLQQETYIRTWLAEDAGLVIDETMLHIHFYPARYHASLQSIFAMGDLCERLNVRDPPNSICILEEPEHVNFYRAPGLVSWRSKFPHVVGVVHTNYKAYAANHIGGVVTAPLVGAMSAFMVRAYCDQVIKLSSVLQEYAIEKEIVCNVHGIRSAFLRVEPPRGNGVYFIGKMLWAKGLDKLLELQAYHKKMTGQYFSMSIYGSGAQMEEIQEAFLGRRSRSTDATSSYEALSKYYSYSVWSGFRQPLPVTFKGRQDHASLSSDYRIFVNPSVTEVLCTATAEAVAMGKWVIIPEHASNAFFGAFPNVLRYGSNAIFLQHFQHAQAHIPQPLSDELRHSLTWEAATVRFMKAASVSERDAARRIRVGQKYDETIAKWHYKLGKGSTGDVLRKVMGAGPVADQHKYESQTNLAATAAAATTTCVR